MTVKYLQWNNLIGEFLFNPGCADKIVPLVISQDDIIGIARNSRIEGLSELDGPEIIASFKEAWRLGYPGTKGNYIDRILQEDAKAIQLYKAGRFPFYCDSVKVNFHPTIMHLAGINLAIIEGKNPSRYMRICEYFNIQPSQFPHMSESLNWNKAWDNLVWWTNDFMKGCLGTLPTKSLSSEKFAYMGKPYTFILLSRAQLNDYYKYLYDNDIEPQSTVDANTLVNAFKSVRKSDSLTSLLNNGDNESKDASLILAILKQLYLAWNGSYVSPTESHGVRTAFQSRKLRLSFEFNDNGFLDFFFRFKEDSLISDHLDIGGQLITFAANQWSSPIATNLSTLSTTFTDPSLGIKLLFKPPESHLFVFANGRPEGLHSDVFIEIPNILSVAEQYVLVNRSLLHVLETWITENHGEDLSDEILDQSFKDWSIIHFPKGFQTVYPSFEKLTFPAEERLDIQSGLKGPNIGEFIKGFPVFVKLTGATGKEILKLTGNTEHEFSLEDGQIFKIPGHIMDDTFTITLPGAVNNVKLTYGGKLKFVENAAIQDMYDDMELTPVFPDKQTTISSNYQQSITLVNNNLFSYPPPPQFNLWKGDQLDLTGFDIKSSLSVKLLEYLVTRPDISKPVFDDALSVITSGLEAQIDTFSDFSKLSTYTLNSLRESSRLHLLSNKDGGVNRINAVRPWLFRLGNYQNFFLEGVKAGLQPFKGRLYGLGGCYTFDLLLSINEICDRCGGNLIIYREENPSALSAPSVFIYTQNNDATVNQIADLLGQSQILPFYRYLTTDIAIEQKIAEFKAGRMWDLHSPPRFQQFNPDRWIFEKKPDVASPPVPSLALYEVQLWEKYYILRFEQDGKQYQGSTEPRWGKYLLLYLSGIRNIFIFDPQKNVLCIPASLRLPVELETDLFYYTGRLPGKIRLVVDSGSARSTDNRYAGKSYLVYKGIIKSSAESVSERVGQQLTYKNLIDYD